MTFNAKMDTDYRVLPGAYCCNNPAERTNFRTGDIVQLRNLNIDSDNDARARRVSDNAWSYINTRFLEEVTVEAKAEEIAVGDQVELFRGPKGTFIEDSLVGHTGKVTQIIQGFQDKIVKVEISSTRRVNAYLDNARKVAVAPTRPLTVDDYFKVGSTIRFTVNAVIDGRVTVGCKNPLLKDVTESLVSMDRTKGTATFEAEVIAGTNGDPVILKHGEFINKNEAAEYFKDVVIVKSAPVRTDVTITLTPVEQDAIWHLLNELSCGPVLTPIKAKLPQEASQSQRRQIFVDGVRKGSARAQLRKVTS